MAKKKKLKKVKKIKKENNLDFQFWIFIFASLLMSVVFLASTLLLLVGMLPTIIAALIVQKKYKHKVLTIGAMNFSGCFPYLMYIWNSTDRMTSMLETLSDPLTVVVMYSAAAVGYILNHLITRLVRVFMLHNADKKLDKIEREKEKLELRWGKKVRGDQVLDIHGFPVIEKEDQENQEAPAKA